MSDPERIARLCVACARSVYGTKPPTVAYADRAARLLFMTGAHESGGWRFRRQQRYGRDSKDGAFGLWQTERASMTASMDWLLGREAAMHHAREFLVRQNAGGQLDLPINEQLHMVQSRIGDALSCLYARLHYFRVPAPIPATPREWAQYAKQHYNTYLGKARPSDYLRAYEREVKGVTDATWEA